MDFELSDDQIALAEAARELLDRFASPAQVREVVDADTGFDRVLWSAMVDQGWPGITVPEAFGGLGLGFVEFAVLLEQTGSHAAPAPFLQQVVALDSLVRGVNSGSGGMDRDQIDTVIRLLRSLINGGMVATVAWQPVAVDEDGRLHGSTEPAIFAPLAEVAVVVGQSASGRRSLRLVDLVETGTVPRSEPAMDRTRKLGWLRFGGAPSIELGGEEAVEAFLDAGAVAHAAEMLGGAARSLDLAVAYAKERHQFGRPIGSFQAVKHRCADMLVDVEGMRSVAYYAAWAYSADDPDRSIAASTAKTWCSDAARRVTASALQVHGGIGFTWECDVHLFLKRAQLDEVSFGDASFHRARLARMLRAKVEAGESVI
ncbi:MAG: acyl-CoA/acyl-ACP dehydrogenase [Acidimicrobiales bacterium]|nr:acyl-CoA/acyl-ACP dehydrogenase [Acidimicrobiales bacterium]